MSEVVKLTIVTESEEGSNKHSPEKGSVGERLTFARTSQGLSVEQIASQLKWSSRQIAEIEAGNYAVLPDLSSVRGFVRTYAKILKLDPVPLMDELSVEFAKLPIKAVDRPTLDTPFPTGRMPWLGRQNNQPQRILGGLFLIALCLVAAFVYRAEIMRLVHEIVPVNSDNVAVEHADAPSVNSEVPVVASAEKQTSSEQAASSTIVEVIAQPAKEDAAETTAPIPVQASVTGNTSTSLSAIAPVIAAAAPKVNDIKPADSEDFRLKERQLAIKNASNNSSAIASASNNALEFYFKQDSWVQIKHLNGASVTSQLYKAGTKEVVNVDGPLSLIIGNAPGVEVKLRGQNVPLPAQVGSNVVNLSVK